MSERLDKDAIMAGVQYTGNFQDLLRELAARALHPDSLLSAAALADLYHPVELVSGAQAAEEAGLSVEEGVWAFVMLSASASAERQRSTMFGRIMSKLPPKPRTREYNHIAMFNYASEVLLPGGPLHKDTMMRFAGRYSELLAANG